MNSLFIVMKRHCRDINRDFCIRKRKLACFIRYLCKKHAEDRRYRHDKVWKMEKDMPKIREAGIGWLGICY